MSLTVWCFRRSTPGTFEPIAHKAMQRLFFHDGCVPGDEDGLVRFAEVLVRLENRKAVDIVSVTFQQVAVLEDGRLDQERHRELMSLAVGTLAGRAKGPSTGGVIEAEHRFAERRMEHLSRWSPTREETQQLHRLVNERAGRTVLA